MRRVAPTNPETRHEPEGSASRGPFRLHRTVLLLASTHFVVDGYGNILAPLLPLFVLTLDLSYFAAGTLQMCFHLASSVSQLAFGHVADKWRPRVLLLAGPLISVTILPLVGLAPNPMVLATVLILGGLGGAAFHPPAAALVHQRSGDQRGLAMSFHITSGTLGQAFAPLLFAPFVEEYGLSATPLLMVPALIVLGAVLLRRMPAIGRLQEVRGGGLRGLRPYAKPLTLLYFIVVLRTLTANSFSTFVPIMLKERGLTLGQAGAAVSVYLFAVGLGGFFGGPAADRFGPRRVIVVSLLSAVPLLVIAPLLSGWQFVLALAAGGFLLQSTLPVNVTFGQTIAPISAATVSSLMMGFAWGVGGIIIPVVGMLADRIGIDRTLMAISLIPIVAAALAVPLPAGTHTSQVSVTP
jgi:FSR family fosmidomycin resistance protein-like MFS transporter